LTANTGDEAEYLATMNLRDGDDIYISLQARHRAGGGIRLLVSSNDRPNSAMPIEWGEAVTFSYVEGAATYFLTHSDNPEAIIRFDDKLRAPENIRFTFERSANPTKQVTANRPLFIRATHPELFWYSNTFYAKDKQFCPFHDIPRVPCPPNEAGDIIHEGDRGHKQSFTLELMERTHYVE